MTYKIKLITRRYNHNGSIVLAIFCLINICSSFRLKYDQLPHSSNFNATISNFLQFLSQILLVSEFLLQHSHTTIYFIPKVFYRIQIRRLSQMPNELKVLCQQLFYNILRSMFQGSLLC